ncbi:MAG TPA: hypothetical protein VNO33_02650 [Kofleriaceae bacterium]|nr:hypothetical protein [Kofleriaceae bacterium]
MSWSGRLPVAVLGGGAYAARLAEVIAAEPELPAIELRLHARDRDRLEVIAAHADGRMQALGAPHRVRASLDLDQALDGAAAVVLLVRVGGLAARDHDETFPARFGLAGDEGVGVGGMANAWRTLPVLDSIADRIAARAPAAHVLNMIAPLGVTTRLLAERGLRVAGHCELPVVTLDRWRAWAGDAVVAYAGLNHLGFFWCPDGTVLDHPVLRAPVEHGELPADLVLRLGAAPLHYYVEVFEPEVARRLGRARAPGRARALAGLQEELVRRFRDQPGAEAPELARRPTPWFDTALVPALRAALGGRPYRGALDIVNGGALEEAPAAVVVELFGTFDVDGVRAGAVPPRPPAVREMIGRLAGAEDFLYWAARAHDRELLAGALDALPLASSPSGRARADLLDCICRPLDSILEGEVRR